MAPKVSPYEPAVKAFILAYRPLYLVKAAIFGRNETSPIPDIESVLQMRTQLLVV